MQINFIAMQINFLPCISVGLALSSVSAALWWKGCVSTAFATSIFLAFSKSIDNNKADSNNNYKGSNQISDLSLKSFCVSDFLTGKTITLSSRTIWYSIMAVQWAWIMAYSQAGKYADTWDLHQPSTAYLRGSHGSNITICTYHTAPLSQCQQLHWEGFLSTSWNMAGAASMLQTL